MRIVKRVYRIFYNGQRFILPIFVSSLFVSPFRIRSEKVYVRSRKIFNHKS